MQKLITFALLAVAGQACFQSSSSCCSAPAPQSACPPPPQPSCGCGGRKKRSLDLPHFTELSATSADELCNSPRLKALLQENMSDDLNTAKTSLASAAEGLNEKFVIVCSAAPVSFATGQQMEFCSARRGDVFCDIFSD